MPCLICAPSLKGEGKGRAGVRVKGRGNLGAHAWSRALIPFPSLFPSPFERLPRRLSTDVPVLLLRAVKGIFVNHELLDLFPVNCEITFLFLVKRDFGNRREP